MPKQNDNKTDDAELSAEEKAEQERQAYLDKLEGHADTARDRHPKATVDVLHGVIRITH